MLDNFCVFEELVFFDLWILDSGFRKDGGLYHHHWSLLPPVGHGAARGSI